MVCSAEWRCQGEGDYSEERKDEKGNQHLLMVRTIKFIEFHGSAYRLIIRVLQTIPLIAVNAPLATASALIGGSNYLVVEIEKEEIGIKSEKYPSSTSFD